MTRSRGSVLCAVLLVFQSFRYSVSPSPFSRYLKLLCSLDVVAVHPVDYVSHILALRRLSTPFSPCYSFRVKFCKDSVKQIL